MLTLIHTIDAYIHRLMTGDDSNTDRSCMHIGLGYIGVGYIGVGYIGVGYIGVGYIGTFTAAACARGHVLTGRQT